VARVMRVPGVGWTAVMAGGRTAGWGWTRPNRVASWGRDLAGRNRSARVATRALFRLGYQAVARDEREGRVVRHVQEAHGCQGATQACGDAARGDRSEAPPVSAG